MMSTETTNYGTRFTESEAILAVINDDPYRLAELIEDMLPGEREALAQAAETLHDTLWDVAGRPDWAWRRDLPVRKNVDRVRCGLDPLLVRIGGTI